MIWLLYKCSFLILLITFHIECDTVAIVNRLCLSLAKQKTRRLSDAVRQIAETRSSTTHVLIEDESLEHHNGSISPFICRNSENISIMWFTRLRMRIHININTAHILRATVQSILHHRGQWTDYILSICLYLTAFIVVCYWRWYFASSRSRKEEKLRRAKPRRSSGCSIWFMVHCDRPVFLHCITAVREPCTSAASSNSNAEYVFALRKKLQFVFNVVVVFGWQTRTRRWPVTLSSFVEGHNAQSTHTPSLQRIVRWKRHEKKTRLMSIKSATPNNQ